MRSTHPDDQRGPRPAWSGVGFGLAALAVALFVIFFAPAAPAPESSPPPTTPGPTISLDELEAMLTDNPGDPPPTFQLETPDGPVTVVVPTTSPQGQTGGSGSPPPAPAPSAPSTTTTTTTAVPSVPRVPRDPLDIGGGIIDHLLGQSAPTTIPEGAGGGS
jgi:hypothetical protein